MIETLTIDRFWREPGVEPNWDEHHFLRDPLDHAYANPGVTLIDVENLPDCFVELGEPGMGKTEILDRCYRAAQSKEGPGMRTWRFDLGSIASDQAFDRWVMRAPALVAWQEGDFTLELFLDGLDECLAGARTIADHIANSLGLLPLQRLRLRLACRAADWPSRLERRLRQLWPERFGLRVLAPLREKDVRSAVEQAGIAAPDEFMRNARSAGALAARPITLDFMLRIAGRNQRLPAGRAALYREGCRLLCAEPNRNRRARRQQTIYTPLQLLAVASRLAVASIPGNRATIVESLEAATDESLVLLWDDIAPATEDVDGEPFQVDGAILDAATATALFRSSGTGVVQWAHRTFGEFLAAEYLRSRHFSLDQKLDLLTIDAEYRVVPQLHETAAFLADIDPEFRRAVIDHDPVAALRADVASFPDSDRERLVEALFRASDRGDVLVRDLGAEDLAALAHSRIGNQLRVRLQSKEDRAVAVAIASAVGPADFVGELVDVAADLSASYTARREALVALAASRDRPEIARLAALLPDAVGTDYDHDLRGLLLDLLWPTHINAEEVFRSLVPPPDDTLQLGPYCRFARNRLPESNGDDFIAAGLRWVARRSRDYETDRFLEQVTGHVLAGAYSRFDEPHIAELLIPVISTPNGVWLTAWWRMTAHAGDDERRHKLLDAVVTHVLSTGIEFPPLPFIRLKDFPWLAERLLASPAGQQPAWASMMRYAFTDEDAVSAEFVRSHADLPAIRDTFRSFLAPDAPDPDDDSAPAHADTEPAGRIHAGWTSLASGAALDDSQWWARAVNQALVEAVSGEKHDWSATSIVESIRKHVPGCNDEALHDAAIRFLRDAQAPEAEDLARRNASAYVYAAACAAITLRESSSRVSATVWRKWQAAILVAPVFGGIDAAEVAVARSQFDDDAVAETILAIARQEVAQGGEGILPMSIGTARHMWNAALSTGFLALLRTRPAPPAYEALLSLLMEHGVAEARTLATTELAGDIANGFLTLHGLAAGRRLIEHSNDAAWDLIWPFVRDVPEEGEKLLGPWMYHNIAHLAVKLGPSQIAELAAHLLGRYGSPTSFSETTPQQDSANTLLNVLMAQGRVPEVTQLRERFPEISIGAVIRAKEAFHRASWRPPSPRNILGLSGAARRRIIHDGPHLLRVILQLLEALQRDLHGINPKAKYLWDGAKPKPEDDIRDWVRDWLDRKHDGLPDLIANKEVQVFAGDYTDIKVQAHPVEPYRHRLPTIDATIEVKGCWHRHVDTAMRDQLRSQYLPDDGPGYGIYLVAWFDRDEWDVEDKRRAACGRTKDEAIAFFEEQAKKLSSGDIVIEAFVLDCSRFRSG